MVRHRSIICPTLTKGSNLRITQIWESDVFRLDLACSTSIPSLEQKHSPSWQIFKSRHNDIALMWMYITDTLCSFTRNFIFKSCFLLSEYGNIANHHSSAKRAWLHFFFGGGGWSSIQYLLVELVFHLIIFTFLSKVMIRHSNGAICCDHSYDFWSVSLRVVYTAKKEPSFVTVKCCDGS